ncbi:MAG: DUF4908 domain-containing protein [Pseudomonadota bacterium]
MALRLVVCVTLAVLALASARDAAAATLDPFSSLVRPSRQSGDGKSRLQRFTAAPDDRNFLLETRRNAARIQFLCAPADPRIACQIDPDRPTEEIFDLSAERGSRGDVLFRDSAGRLVVRVTPYGNATVYWPGEADGLAATKRDDDAGRLRLPMVRYVDVPLRAARAERLLSERFGATVKFDLEEATIANEFRPSPVLADAIVRVAAGFEIVAGEERAAAALKARPIRFRFVEGADPAAVGEPGEVTVTYRPRVGPEGRPGAASMADAIRAAI